MRDVFKCVINKFRILNKKVTLLFLIFSWLKLVYMNIFTIWNIRWQKAEVGAVVQSYKY